MQTKIRDIVETFCNDLISFTSLDISNAVKQEGFPEARHRDIAPVVRQLFADGEIPSFGYTRTLIDVELLNGLKTKTNLYHHVSISPDSYMDRKQVAIPPKKDATDSVAPVAPSQVVPAPVTFSFNSVDDQDDQDQNDQDQDDQTQNDQDGFSESELECYCKTDGRLEIPVSWCKELWSSGDEVKFIIENDKIVAFVGDLDDGETLIGKLMVSSDNRVRVPKTVFMRAGFDYSSRAAHIIRACDGYFEIEDSDF